MPETLVEMQNTVPSGPGRIFPAGVQIICLIVVLALARPLSAAGFTVVDADTGRGLAAVMVVFYWETDIPGPDGGYSKAVHAREAVTAADGSLPLGKASAFRWLPGVKTVFLYKPGYRFESVRIIPSAKARTVALTAVATIIADRKAQWRKFGTLVERIVRCGYGNHICFQDLRRSPDVLGREAEFIASTNLHFTKAADGRVVEQKVRAAPRRGRRSTASLTTPGPGKRGPAADSGAAMEDGIETLLHSSDMRARQRAAVLLGASGDLEAAAPLAQALKDEHWNVRYAAARALGVLRALEAAPALVRALGDERRVVRREAAAALEAMGTAVFPALESALADQDPRRRGKAAVLLAKTGRPQAVELLIQALEDPEPPVRKSVVISLGQMESRRAVLPLLALLETETDPSVRSPILDTLARIGDPRAVAPMMTLLLEDPRRRGRSAGKVLNRITPEGLDALIGAVDHADAAVRLEVAGLLGASGNERAVAPLIRALSDEEIGVRNRAIQSLARIGDPRSVEPLLALWKHPSADMRSRSALAITAHGRPAVGPLVRLLKDADPYLRWRAAWALGYLVEPGSGQMGDGLRSTAGRERVRDPRSTQALIGALSDPAPEVRFWVIRALAELKSPEAASPLRARLSDRDAGIRAAASGAIDAISGRP